MFSDKTGVSGVGGVDTKSGVGDIKFDNISSTLPRDTDHNIGTTRYKANQIY